MMRKPWLLPLLLVAAAAVTVQNVIFFTSGPDDSAEWSDDEDEADGDESDDGAVSPLASIASAEIVEYVAALPNPELARNPFLTRIEVDELSAGIVVGETTPPLLDGTLYSAARRVAWLDGTPLSEGDRVRGFELVRIDPDAVLLRSSTRDVLVEVTGPPAAPAAATPSSNRVPSRPSAAWVSSSCSRSGRICALLISRSTTGRGWSAWTTPT